MPSSARFGLSTARMGGNLKKQKLFVESLKKTGPDRDGCGTAGPS